MSLEYHRRRYRLYPTKEQKAYIKRLIGACRFVWNWAVDRCEDEYYKTGKTPPMKEISKEFTKLKKTEGYEWLQELDALALTQVFQDLRKAYRNFFDRGYNKPKFKRKKDAYRTRLNPVQPDKNNYINVAILRLMKIQRNANLENPKTYITITHTASDKYFVTVTEYKETNPKVIDPDNIKKVGIDVGIKTFITTDTGEKIYSPEYLKQSLKRLKQRHRAYSRKVPGSRNAEKARIKLALMYEKVTNQRKDFIHKVTHRLVTEYDEIHTETLNVEAFFHSKFSKNIRRKYFDVSLGEFFTQLKYKCRDYGVNLIQAPNNYPSSQLCSNCGFQNRDVRNLRLREWTCPVCGCHHDRDINAAINLVNYYPSTSA